jgi:hypothetical protein
MKNAQSKALLPITTNFPTQKTPAEAEHFTTKKHPISTTLRNVKMPPQKTKKTTHSIIRTGACDEVQKVRHRVQEYAKDATIW